MTPVQLENYAKLLLWSVGDVAKQNVAIRCEPESRALAIAVAEAAYKSGARLVDINYTDPLLTRARIDHASEAGLEAISAHEKAGADELARDDWTYIALIGSGYPDALAGSDPARSGRYFQARRASLKEFMKVQSRFHKAWVGAIAPTAAMARKPFPDLDDAVARILHLNDADPTLFWSDAFTKLIERQHAIEALELDSLHFTGPDTDLEIGLHKGGRWQTAEATLPGGRTVRVNMPSCEIFTTPDARRTNGRVATTRPFVSTSAPGRIIEGAWLEFEDGAVVRSGAREGAELLQRILEMDARARYLGEVALVDESSPVAHERFVFHNVLFDENAACHIALGNGFPRLIPDTEWLDPDELCESGVNHSIVHDDLMIGGPEVSVTGKRTDGSTVEIMRDGSFAL